jgi:polyisoprenoid-binding protein YceI
VGVIQVNARTLATDSQFRDRAIKNRILSTDTYEFVTFTPKQLVGLPASGTVGETYTFQIVGDLTIRDTTREATFDVTVTPTSDTSLEGTAQTTIRYADYGITIPQVRQVASVSDEVRLEIDFVATAA